MGGRGASSVSRKTISSDWQKLTSGAYDVHESMGTIHSIEVFSIKQAMREKVEEAPSAPRGAVSAETRKQARKSLEWYDKNYTESLNASKAYRAEIQKFNSKEIKALLQQQAKRWEENAESAIKNKEWFKRAYKQYL